MDNLNSTGRENPLAKRMMSRYDADKKIWDEWSGTWQECYDYALPHREQFFGSTRKRATDIYDETAIVALQEFGSKISTTMMPPFMRWSDLKVGRGIPEEQREQLNLELEQVNKFLFEQINESNFYSEVPEAVVESAIGTGVLVIDESIGAGSPFNTRAIPLTHVVLGIGPFGMFDAMYLERPKTRISDIRHEWPTAVITETMASTLKQNENAIVDLLDVTMRDWSAHEETWVWALIEKGTKEVLATKTMSGIGSCPWIPFRWSRGAGEVYGRGPLLNALPAIKTTNYTVELVLLNGEMAASGMYQYDDDGFINPDAIQIGPRTFIPRAPGSRGLEALASPARFDISNMILADMRDNIKRALYADQFAPLGKTPQSATEVAYRQQDLAQRIGSSYGRLQRDLVSASVKRMLYILKRKGLVDLPKLNGREVKVEPLSPMVRSQRNDDIMAIDRFLEQIAGRFGPEAIMTIVDGEATAKELSELYGISPRILLTAEKRAQIMQQMQQMAAAQQGQGQPPQ